MDDRAYNHGSLSANKQNESDKINKLKSEFDKANLGSIWRQPPACNQEAT